MYEIISARHVNIVNVDMYDEWDRTAPYSNLYAALAYTVYNTHKYGDMQNTICRLGGEGGGGCNGVEILTGCCFLRRF
jgi:hypothetical protein